MQRASIASSPALFENRPALLEASPIAATPQPATPALTLKPLVRPHIQGPVLFPKAPPPYDLAAEREENRQAVIQARVLATAVASDAARMADEWARMRGQVPPSQFGDLQFSGPPPVKRQALDAESFLGPVNAEKAPPPTPGRPGRPVRVRPDWQCGGSGNRAQEPGAVSPARPAQQDRPVWLCGGRERSGEFSGQRRGPGASYNTRPSMCV